MTLDEGALQALYRSGEVGAELQRRANSVEAAAKGFCPVDTGRLRSSITTALGEDGEGLYADIGTDVSYGIFVEFGTRRAAAQPFLRPALDAAG